MLLGTQQEESRKIQAATATFSTTATSAAGTKISSGGTKISNGEGGTKISHGGRNLGFNDFTILVSPDDFVNCGS